MSELFEALEVVGTVGRYQQWVIGHFKPFLSGIVFDIGSGRGDMAELYDIAGVEKIILSDHSPEMIAFLEKRFGDRKNRYAVLPLADISLTERAAVFNGNAPDTVISLNVLEHIPDDVAAIGNMAQLLRPGGKLLIMVPALPAIHGTLDDMAVHCRRYTKEELVLKVTAAGFKVDRAYYMNFFGVFSWFIAGRVLRQKRFDTGMCQALDRVVPFLKAIESVVPPPLGQSLILIAHRT